MQIVLGVMMGGCVSSGHFERQQPNVFQVWNVDEYGESVTPGHIELTDSSLVLHQKSSREAVIWPMRSLRRYGFDAELFSFESGRRCTTGPGVYAFKCRRAETLFNLLQERILSSGQDDLSNHSGVTLPPPPPTTTLPSSVQQSLLNNLQLTQQQQQQTQLPVRQTSPITPSDNDNYLEPIVINRSNSNASQHNHHPYANDMSVENSDANYVNTSPEHVTRQLSSSSEPQPQLSASVTLKTVTRGHSLDDETNYAKLDDLLKQEHTANRHLYMNVTVSSSAAGISSNDAQQPNVNDDSTETFSCDHCYANVAPVSSSSTATPVVKAMRHSKSMFNYPRQVNYAILDLRKRSRNNNNSVKMNTATATVEVDTTLNVPPPNATLRGYAKIDFDKTTALSNSINPCLDDDQSVRKTRHNSNASSLFPKRTSLADGD